MKCYKCGEEIEDSSKFCPYCGTAQNIPPAAETETPVEVLPEEPAAPEEPVTPEETNIPEEPVVAEEPSVTEEAEVVQEPEEVEAVDITEPGKPTFEDKIKDKFKDTKIPEIDVNDFKSLLTVLKDPAKGTEVPLLPAVCIIIASVIILTGVVHSSIIAMVKTLYSTMFSGYGLSGYNISQSLSSMGYTYFSFFSTGLFLTAFIYAAFTLVNFLNDRNITSSLLKAAGQLFVPVLASLAAWILFNFSFNLGMCAAVFAVMTCVLTIIKALKRTENSYIVIAAVSLFIILLAVVYSTSLSSMI